MARIRVKGGIALKAVFVYFHPDRSCRARLLRGSSHTTLPNPDTRSTKIHLNHTFHAG